ncbi:MAG: hypothetical protein KZQ89_21380 [Candidatus Thiodiazotropha sp. (ex Lucinoma kastoroae)]|nr:hypothetical protein [Candidatus Thiodiazotropha sp. (ex Lucinoma kastoroae)]MCU7860454.1 hypothetical protein [Candidatus Thiodiazotropha sp. (ex Lucinoma kastoroae)]
MGQSFAITAVTAGATSAIGHGDTVGQVLARGAVQMGRQYVESGKVTNWSGVALAMVGRSGVSATSNWSSTVSFVNKHRNTLSSGLSVVEKLARGKDVNTLDWTHVAAAAIGGGSAGGHYYNQSGFQWDTIAREALITGGLSLVVSNRFGGDAAANFFGSQLGSMAASAMQEREAYSRPSALEVAEAVNEATDSYSQLQGMNRNAERRAQAERNRTQAVADEQQGDRNWMVDAPGERRSEVQLFAATPQVWEEAAPPSQTTQTPQATPGLVQAIETADFAAAEVSAAPSDAELEQAWQGDVYGLSASGLPQDLYTMSPEFEMGGAGRNTDLQANYGFLQSNSSIIQSLLDTALINSVSIDGSWVTGSSPMSNGDDPSYIDAGMNLIGERIKSYVGDMEALAAIGSRSVGEVVSGLTMIVTGGDVGAGRAVGEAFAYMPRTQYGQQRLQMVGEVMEPVVQGLDWNGPERHWAILAMKSEGLGWGLDYPLFRMHFSHLQRHKLEVLLAQSVVAHTLV